ncbi:MAG: hypothetical protein KC656_24420, partial [Myxococcales bacterium]|nr:hypothetical protein [Myxococcales bacterium]
DGATFTPGSTATRTGPGGEALSVSLTAPTACPDTGPGVSCVTVTTTVRTVGVAAEGEPPVGGERVVATWIVEPSTLRPHGGELVRTATYAGADGVPVVMSRTLTLQVMPTDPPAPLP